MKKAIATIGIGVALAGGGTITADRIIDPYVDKGTTLEISKASVLKDAGDISLNLVKARPEVRLKKWNGAVDLGISFPDVKANGSRVLLTDRMEWKDADKEVHAYPLDPTDQMKDGGLELEVILNQQPSTNIFNFTVDGYENLDFAYQSKLTAKQIASGDYQPENIIGSYAVYYKDHQGHVSGKTNYGTGKAFHIFRPKAIDANGDEIWAELSYTNGILTVEVDQDWLNNAAYPVKIDPTVGVTDVGGTTTTTASGDVAYGFTSVRYTRTAVTDEEVSDINLYADSTGDSGVAIYDYVSGSPDSRLQSVQTINIGASADWYTANFSLTVPSGTDYTIGFDPFLSASTRFYWDNFFTTEAKFSNQTSLVDPFDVDIGFTTTRRVSIYATYTSTGPGPSCTYSGSGDWEPLYSDNCYVQSYVNVLGDCHFIYDAAGSFKMSASGEISCRNIQGSANFQIAGALGAKIHTRETPTALSEFSYLTTANSTADLTTYTFSSVSLGTADADRCIVVSAVSRKAGAAHTLSSMTIGGVSATIIQNQNNKVTNSDTAALAAAIVPTGTTGDIVVTWSTGVLRTQIGVWRIVGASSCTSPYDSDASIAADPSVNIDVPEGGAVIGAGLTAAGTSATWTGATEDFDNTLESFVTATGASLSGLSLQTGRTMTIDFGSATESSGVFGSWGP